MPRPWPSMLALVAGCSFGASEQSTIDAPLTDSGTHDGEPIDAPRGPCAGTLVGTQLTVCLLVTPSMMLTVPGGAIQTDTSTQCASPGTYTSTPDVCLLVGESINVPPTITASGTRPLMLVAWNGDVMIGGAGGIDVSSHDAVVGAAAPLTCTGGTAPNNGTTTFGGGFGGSYGGQGGGGGSGDAGGNGGIPAAAGGFTTIAGGCPGSAGDGTGAGVGGVGGGAVWIIATGKIQIDGSIDASGAGGRGAMQGHNAGGGGGGAGGLIGLDAPTIAGSGAVFANGGGGGEGCGSVTNGHDGGESSAPFVAAAGGSGGGNGGDGGDGSSGTTLTGDAADPGTQGDGGGGGGGGAGIVKIDPGISPPANLAPPAT